MAIATLVEKRPVITNRKNAEAMVIPTADAVSTRELNDSSTPTRLMMWSYIGVCRPGLNGESARKPATDQRRGDVNAARSKEADDLSCGRFSFARDSSKSLN